MALRDYTIEDLKAEIASREIYEKKGNDLMKSEDKLNSLIDGLQKKATGTTESEDINTMKFMKATMRIQLAQIKGLDGDKNLEVTLNRIQNISAQQLSNNKFDEIRPEFKDVYVLGLNMGSKQHWSQEEFDTYCSKESEKVAKLLPHAILITIGGYDVNSGLNLIKRGNN